MTVEDYFGMIINISKGLTLIALMLIFLYMIYGEKKEGSPSSTEKMAVKISQSLSRGLCRLHALL